MNPSITTNNPLLVFRLKRDGWRHNRTEGDYKTYHWFGDGWPPNPNRDVDAIVVAAKPDPKAPWRCIDCGSDIPTCCPERAAKIEGIASEITTEILMEEKLVKLCKEFIAKYAITCPETIYQMDCVIVNAPELVENICDIVGYAPQED